MLSPFFLWFLTVCACSLVYGFGYPAGLKGARVTGLRVVVLGRCCGGTRKDDDSSLCIRTLSSAYAHCIGSVDIYLITFFVFRFLSLLSHLSACGFVIHWYLESLLLSFSFVVVLSLSSSLGPSALLFLS
ncbi:hypothetical protein EX30DRAFT_141904 [Ascodesmis nigricans]|uniref:Secreted protein n=1 Tax=Ascodesmis nigricans TaxID=341454 RepID=A0A4S2N135_9PEZI|nr:hypothetical protein EX30DRAFT_141904 [Ascodesmis nigricans]